MGQELSKVFIYSFIFVYIYIFCPFSPTGENSPIVLL